MTHNFDQKNVARYLDNKRDYGRIANSYDENEMTDYWALAHTLSELIIGPPVGLDMKIEPVLPINQIYPEQTENFGFDEIFCINLKRRPDRREKMFSTFELMGIGPVTYPGAVDGHKITQKWLDDNGIAPLAGFTDPYHGRTLTKGEIGCFLSHWRLWLYQVKHGLERIIIFEDDVRLEMDFNNKFKKVLKDIDVVRPDWELLYLGRKKLQVEEPEIIPYGGSHFVEADYSYWTLAYALTLEGAKKLIAQAPLDRLLPVDEYLPIMYDRYDKPSIYQHFSPRDLKAYSAEPLLLYPTHYVGQENYFSDTEKSGLWEKAKSETEKVKVEGLEAKRVTFDDRFTIDSVIKNYQKWESDLKWLTENDKDDPKENWMADKANSHLKPDKTEL